MCVDATELGVVAKEAGDEQITNQCLKRFYVGLYCNNLISRDFLIRLFASNPEWRAA